MTFLIALQKKDMPWKYHILVQMSVCRIDRNIMKAVLYRIGQYLLYKKIHLSDYSPDHVSYPEACHISQCIYITVSLTLFPIAGHVLGR